MFDAMTTIFGVLHILVNASSNKHRVVMDLRTDPGMEKSEPFLDRHMNSSTLFPGSYSNHDPRLAHDLAIVSASTRSAVGYSSIASLVRDPARMALIPHTESDPRNHLPATARHMELH